MKKSNFTLFSKFDENFWYVEARRDLLRKILLKHFSTHSTHSNLKILDAGCGVGFNGATLKDFGSVYGVDVNKSAIMQAKQYDYTALFLKDVNALKYKKYFDVIVAIELIEHIKDDQKTIQNFKKYLKPGGILILTTPAFKFLWGADDDLAMHERRYSKKRIRDIIIGSGMKIELLTYRYFFQFIPALIIFFLQRSFKKNSLEYTPKIFNNLLTKIMQMENSMICARVRFPIGVGFVVVAQKPYK